MPVMVLPQIDFNIGGDTLKWVHLPVDFTLPHAELGQNDHREDALLLCTTPYIEMIRTQKYSSSF